MRIGILGAGFMGQTHARAYAKIPGVEIVAISSQHRDKAEKLTAEVGGRAVTDDRAILEDASIYAISNTLPTHLHPETTIAALKAGKHVLLEKPFALTAPECDGMIAAAEASGRTFMVAHVCRFWGEYVSLVELVHSGRLGKPLSANASRLSQLPAWATWFLDPALSGGAVLDLSVHDFDVVNWVLGTPKTVYGRGHEYRPGLWNDIHAEIDYGGANGFVEGSEFMPEGYPFSCSLRVICEGGVAEFSFRAGGVSVEMGGGSSLMVYEAGKAYPLTPKPGDAYQNQTDAFVACVREGRQPALGTAEQARLAVRTANAVRESFETGKVVAI
jgi:predicted dehydrogenase